MKQSRSCFVVLACLLLTLSASPAFAQASFGLRLTAAALVENSNYWGQKSTHASPRIGLGAFMIFPLNDKIALQPELNYLTYAAAAFQDHTFSLPVLLTYKLSPAIGLEGGPSLERDFNKYYAENLKPNFNVGVNAGANYFFNANWSANLRFNYEVMRTKDNVFITSDPTDPLLMPTDGKEPGFRQMTLSASLRYIF